MWVLILAGRVIMCTVPECYNYGDCAQDSGDQDQRCGVRSDWSFIFYRHLSTAELLCS